ncbi:MAG: hypothetical protein EXS12_07025 [Phycisphaerales bacterium]|nr:hypothetical protein [Phycisphaerales bacterium]
MNFLAHLRARPLAHVATAAIIFSSAGISGCMDDATLAQRQSDKKINETIAAGQKAMVEVSTVDPDVNRTCAESLRKVAASATAPSGATPNQKATLALIAFNLHMQAAQLDYAMIELLEKVQRTEADHAMLFSSFNQQFAVLAKTVIQEVPAEAREVLQKDQDASAMTMTVLSEQTTKLKDVVDAATSTSDQHKSKALELEKQANMLKQKAIAAGPIDGLKLTVESQKTMNDSRKLQSQAAIIDLNSQSATLEHRIASNTENAYQASINRNKTGMQDIDAIEALHKSSVNELSRLASSYCDAAIASAKSLRACDEKLNALYEEAMGSLEKAVSLAQQSTNSGGQMSKSAKFALTSAQLALAGMAEHRAGASALVISAYTAVAKIDQSGSWSKDAAAQQTIRAAATAKAIEAFESVLSAIPEGGGDENANKFRKGIELAKANFSGTTLPTNAPDTVKSDGDASTPVQAPTEDGSNNEPKDSANNAPTATDPATDPAATDPASPPPVDPPADPAATDPASPPPVDPPADPTATDPASPPPVDPPADPTATDPASPPPVDPPNAT